MTDVMRNRGAAAQVRIWWVTDQVSEELGSCGGGT